MLTDDTEAEVDDDEENVEKDKEGNEEMDEETKNWNVPVKFKDDLDEIKPIFRAVPLPVFVKKVMVEPSEVTKSLANATVEISFTIHHTYIKKKDESVEVDSFKAQIEQITILKKHVSTVMSNPSPRMGPLNTHKPLLQVPTSATSTAPRPTKCVKLNVAPQPGPSGTAQAGSSGTSKEKERITKMAKGKKKIEVEGGASLGHPATDDVREKTVDEEDVVRQALNKGKEKEVVSDVEDKEE